MTWNRLARLLAVLVAMRIEAAQTVDPLEAGFREPPPQARLRCYWWWLNGNVTRQSITRDLEAMKAKGFGGVMVIDAGGAEQRGNQPVPAGPLFGGPAWRELFHHALAEAGRLGLEVSLNILSGWNLGGPTVTPEQSAKVVTWSKTEVKGPALVEQLLPAPPAKEGFYRDIAVLAYPLRHGPAPTPRPIRQLEIKGSFKEAGFSTPVTTPLLFDVPAEPGEQDTASGQVVNVTELMDGKGKFRWDAPPGDWEILRFGYTSSGSRVSTSSGGWQGLVIDYLDRTSLEKYWKDVVEPILAENQQYLGKPLAYAVTDSWELEGVNWSARFGQEFQRRRGYDPSPYLPVLAGRIVDSRDISVRFLNDLRRTVGDLVTDEHYEAFGRLAERAHLGIHPESGGPHGAPVDALQALGRSTFPQMEYWAKSATHRVTDGDRFFVKEAASAAHIYGKTLVGAEGFTSIGPHWQESLWSNLKPTFDRALCEGLNRHIWHTVTSSPAEMGVPGQEYFAGTHFNPNVTWWQQSGPFLLYLNRGQFLMQQGHFDADVLYYYGDHVPNFVRLKSDDPAKVLPGNDYDVTNEEVLLTRVRVSNGRIALPDGMSYRLLVLPDLPMISLPALRKIRDLVSQGATILGHKPERTTGLQGFPAADQEVGSIANEVWGRCDGKTVHEHAYGKGRVICSGTARELLLADHVAPDFEVDAAPAPLVDYIHRTAGETEIYFVSNQSDRLLDITATFRVDGKAPELWDAVSGDMRQLAHFNSTADRRTALPLHLQPFGSCFVVFRHPNRHPDRKPDVDMRVASIERDGGPAPEANVWFGQDRALMIETPVPGHYSLHLSSGSTLETTAPPLDGPVTLAGPWEVSFTSAAAKPTSRSLAQLTDWTQSADTLLKYFSGTATYSKDVDIPASMLASDKRLWLELGSVRELAEIRMNGKDLGVQWAPPFSVDITSAARAGRNHLEIRVVNLWANRVIGDSQLPVAERSTRTNITQLTKDSQLIPSGLLGPVLLRSVVLRRVH